MYKQIGFQFDNLEPEQLERLYYTIRAIEDFHLKKDPKSANVSPATEKRATARVKITPDLPRDVQMTIWFMFQNRFRKCLIKDVSETGAGIILPFEDRGDLFKKERPFTALIDLRSDLAWSDARAIIVRSVIRYDRELQPNAKVKIALSSLNSEVHPIDHDFHRPNTKKQAEVPYEDKDEEISV